MPRFPMQHRSTLPPPANGKSTSKRWPHTIVRSRCGRSIARKTSRTALHWSGRRSLVSKTGRSMLWSFTNRPSARHRQTALCRTRRSPTNWRRASTLHVGLSRSRIYICETPATAMFAGEPTGRCGNSIGSIRYLRENEPVPGRISTIGAPVEHLDLATVVKVSQAVSGEIVLEKLIETLLRTAIEQASAERGLLILAHGGELSIRAEANTSGTSVMVCLRDTPVSAAELPESVIRYVARTQESVIIEDASAQNPFSADEYFHEKRARSVLCLPLLKQRALIALLYLENNLAARIFTPARLTVLNVLASQAAMSLENSLLYRDLAKSEDYLAEAQSLSHTGSFGWVVSTEQIFWSDETFRIFEYDTAVKPTVELALQRVHPEDKGFVRQVIDRAAQDGKGFHIEYRLLMPDKRVKYLHVTAHRRSDDSGDLEFIGAVRDITAAKIAQQKLKQDEAELRQLINFVPEHVLVMDADGRRLYENQAMREYFGTSLEDIQAKEFYTRFVHPEDVASGALEERERAVLRGVAWEGELRLRRKDGEYRWFLIRCNPLRDEQGKVIRRYTTATDIDDRKRAEERVQKENVALREEIDKASMFEEIVGSSAALKEVLARVSQVAPTDATVLLTGRNRDRKGTHRSCHPQTVTALRKSFCHRELRSYTPDPNRLGTIRP